MQNTFSAQTYLPQIQISHQYKSHRVFPHLVLIGKNRQLNFEYKEKASMFVYNEDLYVLINFEGAIGI